MKKKKKNEDNKDNDNDSVDIGCFEKHILLWKNWWYKEENNGKNNKFKNIFTLKNNQNFLNGYNQNTINDYKNGINFFNESRLNKNIK